MELETCGAGTRRLHKGHSQARLDEVFGGLSSAERAEYEIMVARIKKLERELSLEARKRRF